MSICSYLFKSTREEIENLTETEKLRQNFKGIESTGIDPTTLTILESILTGEDLYQIYEKGEYSVIKKVDEEDDNSPLFVSSSTSLMNSLKELDTKKIKDVLNMWCSTQEMKLYGWTPRKAKHIIDWLVKISKQNHSPEEQIILYIDMSEDEPIAQSV